MLSNFLVAELFLMLIIVSTALSSLLYCADSAADVDQCCKDGLQEAESSGDVEMQAEFLYCGAIFCLVSEKPVDKVIVIFKVCVSVYFV